VRIQINGEQREFPERSLSLDELIDTLSLPPQRIAVEVNKTIVRRRDWPATTLQDGDQIEIVHFVGGGSADSRNDARNFCSIRERCTVESSSKGKGSQHSCHHPQEQ
jgi:thiamine biosynthesis protein ThiS